MKMIFLKTYQSFSVLFVNFYKVSEKWLMGTPQTLLFAKQINNFASLITAYLAPALSEHSPHFLELGSLTQKY